MTIKGVQISMTVDLDFQVLSDALFEQADIRHDVEALTDIWNAGGLGELLETYFDSASITAMATRDGDRYPIQVNSGYFG